MKTDRKHLHIVSLIMAVFLLAAAILSLQQAAVAKAPSAYAETQEEDGGNGAQSVSAWYYDFLPRDVMPVLGFVAMPNENAYTSQSGFLNPTYITYKHFQTYKEAGFNIISGLYEREPFNTYEIRRAVDIAEELGLVYFVQDLDVRGDVSYEAMKELISSRWYMEKKAFGGISLKDEPSVNDYTSMGLATQALKELAPDKVTHSTLFPWGASAGQFGIDYMPNETYEEQWEMYEEYVSRYMREVDPKILAYDCYLLFYENDDLLHPQTVRARAIKYAVKSLSLFRKTAKEHGIPFWVTVAPYNHLTRVQIPKKHFEWNVNLSLAYGAKGVQYYTYWTLMEHYSQDALTNHQYAGLVTLGGTPHNTYYSVQDVNRQIQAVDAVLMGSESIGLMQFGYPVLPLPEEDVLESFGELKNITGGDALVGCFDHNGKNVYYIVHDSIVNGSQTFTVSFDKKCDVRLINAETDKIVEDTYSVGVNLSGGEAVLIEVEE